MQIKLVQFNSPVSSSHNFSTLSFDVYSLNLMSPSLFIHARFYLNLFNCVLTRRPFQLCIFQFSIGLHKFSFKGFSQVGSTVRVISVFCHKIVLTILSKFSWSVFQGYLLHLIMLNENMNSLSYQPHIYSI